MLRALFMIVAVCCVALVATELAGFGYLWMQGRLTAETVQDVRDVVLGKIPDASAAEDPDESPSAPPSSEDVMQTRIERLFELGNREDELMVLKTMISEQAQRVTAQQEQLQKKRDDFEEKLARVREVVNEESIQQARAVLQAQQPADAADSVMGLSFDQSLAVVRGMPEKTIARILKELSKSDDNLKKERGRKLLEAITEGEPSKSLIEATAKELSPSAPATR